MEREESTPPGSDEEQSDTSQEKSQEEQVVAGYEEVEEDHRLMEEEWNGFIQGSAAEDQEVVEEWRPGQPVTPKQVLRMKRYTREYLCSPEDNIYDINFSRFKIRDMESGAVILDINRDIRNMEPKDIPVGRFIRYHFSPSFLALHEIGALLEFSVGSEAVSGFRLIERHFFRNRLLKTFDFDLGFCIPHSVNTCEHIYCLPDLGPDIVDEMIANSYETRSDSFYFANDKLIMHHKAEYSFKPL